MLCMDQNIWASGDDDGIVKGTANFDQIFRLRSLGAQGEPSLLTADDARCAQRKTFTTMSILLSNINHKT